MRSLFPALGVSLACVLATLPSGCSGGASAPVVWSGPIMGTAYTVKAIGLPAAVSRSEAGAEIASRLERINQLMSTYLDDSELSRFNRTEAGEWYRVSEETAIVVAAAIGLHRLTGGAFDITVGPLVNLWSFGPDGTPERVPDDDEIAAAALRCGSDKIDVGLEPASLIKSRDDVYVDLSAIAKGFAVDQVAEYLDEIGVTSYMVEVGGEVRARGRKSDGSAWRIGIEAPQLDGGRSLSRAVPLLDGALATSGDYRNYFEVDGVRYSHTIDPRTGRPVRHALASVTVVAESCARADGLATALMVLGPVEGRALAQKNDIAALFLVRTESGIVEDESAAFTRLIGAMNQEAKPES